MKIYKTVSPQRRSVKRWRDSNPFDWSWELIAKILCMLEQRFNVYSCWHFFLLRYIVFKGTQRSPNVMAVKCKLKFPRHWEMLLIPGACHLTEVCTFRTIVREFHGIQTYFIVIILCYNSEHSLHEVGEEGAESGIPKVAETGRTPPSTKQESSFRFKPMSLI